MQKIIVAVLLLCLPVSALGAEYLLVTSPDLADPFQNLLAHKQSRGLDAEMVILDSGTTAEGLHSLIRASGASYVLLGGDVEHVPHKMVRVEANGRSMDIASDGYYRLWDDGHDPDCALGRAPVSTPTEAVNFVSKVIEYETTAPASVNVSLWTSGSLDASTWGADSSELLRDGGTTASGLSVPQTVPDYVERIERYRRDLTASTESVIEAINTRSPHLMSYVGHSSPASDAWLSRDTVDALENATPFIHFSTGCQAGQFEKAAPYDAITEHMLKAEHGAVAAVSNSGLGWYAPDGFGGGDWWHHEWLDALYNEGIRSLGDALNDIATDRKIGPLYPTDLWEFYSYNLLGDPETPFWVSIPGDANLDGQVNSEDLAILGLRWKPGEELASWTDGDFSADGMVDPHDLAMLSLHWNEGVAGTTIPEPGMALLLLAALPKLTRRRQPASYC